MATSAIPEDDGVGGEETSPALCAACGRMTGYSTLARFVQESATIHSLGLAGRGRREAVGSFLRRELSEKPQF